MDIPKHSYTSLADFITFLYTAKGYLEKANGNNLGDFTDEGKIVNAGYANYTVYWKWYKDLGYGSMQGNPYCACAVSTMMVAAFGLATAKKLLCGDLYTYCPTGYNQFNAKKRAYKTPTVGDVVFFWHADLNRFGHTGLVVGVDSNGKGYTTWEANTSSGNNTVVRNGGATCIKHYDAIASTTRFGRPDYVGNGISIDGTETGSVTPATVEIGCGSNGLKCTIDLLNVRDYPATGNVISSVKRDDYVSFTEKCFVNGDPWFYSESIGGWCSGKYFEGWIQEKSDGNKWWYLESGYKYPVNTIKTIDNVQYFFGSDGYLFIGTMTLTTDDTGALKMMVQ